MSDPVVLLSTGDVVGPAGGVTDNSMVLFSGTSGKLIKGNNAQVTAAGLALLDDVDAAAQRSTLQLKTGALSDVTTSANDATAGRLLKVGDFGLGAVDLQDTAADLNTISATGFYLVTGANQPSGQNDGFLIVTSNGAANSCQRYITQGNPREFIRVGGNSTWGAWQEIALIDSPAFIGTPTAPTASAGTNTTQLANTAFVKAAVDDAPRVGVGQTWQDVTGSRGASTNYTNTTGKPIEVSVSFSYVGQGMSYIVVDGVAVNSFTYSLGGTGATMSAIVPNGSVYSAVGAKVRWTELR